MAAEKLGFPVILAAHDHELYLEEIEGCKIIKTGMDANAIAVVDIVWISDDRDEVPNIEIQVYDTADFEPDPDCTVAMKEHNKPVDALNSGTTHPMTLSLALNLTLPQVS